MLLLAFTSVAVFANGVLSDYSTTPLLKNYAVILKQFTTTSIVPMAILFIRRIRKITRNDHPLELLWIVIPVVLGTSAILLYMLSGDEAVTEILNDAHINGYGISAKYKNSLAYFFYVSTQLIWTAVVLVEVIWFIIYSIVLFRKERFRFGNVFKFFFKGERIKTVELQNFFILVLAVIFTLHFVSALDMTADFLIWNIVISLLISFCMSAIAFIAMFGSKRTITQVEILNGWRYNYSTDNKQAVVEQMMCDLLDDAEEEALIHIQEKIGENLGLDHIRDEDVITEPERAEKLFSAVAKSWEEDELFKRFQHVMLEEKVFLQPKLTLNDVADMLETNTTYVSKMVNNAYNLGFPELVNTLRIDYAEQFILNNRDAKQTEIATKCGFLSASSFNTIFKRITGVTPKIWIASADLQQKTRR
jgi:AraC-like DNA-binding protein